MCGERCTCDVVLSCCVGGRPAVGGAVRVLVLKGCSVLLRGGLCRAVRGYVVVLLLLPLCSGRDGARYVRPRTGCEGIGVEVTPFVRHARCSLLCCLWLWVRAGECRWLCWWLRVVPACAVVAG